MCSSDLGHKEMEQRLKALEPALELLADRYGMDPSNPDYDALAKAVTGDGRFYEEAATQNGRSVDDQMQISRMERESRLYRQMREEERQQRDFQAHIQKLKQQGETLKQVFPGFDLQQEMQDPAFVRMTSPSGGLTVEQAYRAIHYQEIETAIAQTAAQRAAENVAASIRSGAKRPREAGSTAQAPSVADFSYANMSKAQRDQLKKQIYAAQARGEKLYPGR